MKLRPRHLLRGGVKAYQALHPMVFSGCCRFSPTCSHYALEALETHGSFKGALLSAARVWRCQPLYPAGYDPVPEAQVGLRASLRAWVYLGPGPVDRLRQWFFKLAGFSQENPPQDLQKARTL